MSVTKKTCVFCDRPAVAGWLDRQARFTPVCEAHRWIAVAACGSAQAEYINLKKRGSAPPNHAL